MAQIKSITVYLGSSGHARPVFYAEAHALGKKMAEAGVHLVFGGMNAGAMRSVSDAVLEYGGEVIGVIPTKIRDSERVSCNISRLIDVETMWERKRLMFDLGDALIMMPGGYGTLDEGLEAVYWKSLGLHSKEIIFIDVDGYWSPLFDFIEESIANGSMPPETKNLFRTVSSAKSLDLSSIKKGGMSEETATFPHFEDEIFMPTRTPLIIDVPDLAGTYKLMTALVTKQLAAHDRHIGLLNQRGQFDHLLAWVKVAAKERFITRKCPKLMTVRRSAAGLLAALERQEHVIIDLHRDKWGD